MRLPRLDYAVAAVSALGLLALAALVLRGDQVGLSIVRFAPQANTAAAASAPIVIEFAQDVDAQTVEANFSLQPEAPGAFLWRGSTLYFVPLQAWQPDTQYTVRLRGGFQDALGHKMLEDLQWSFTVRPAGLLFLRDDGDGYEIWRLAEVDSQPEKLTSTEGHIYDFSTSVDGEQIVYSVINDQDGIDLWVMDRDGGNPAMLVRCGPDRCSAPAWSVDGRLAYSRASAPLAQGEGFSAPRIWVYDPATGEDVRLHADVQQIGFGPKWSPDASKLAYFDGVQSRIVVLSLDSGEETYLTSRVGVVGSWSADGSQMIYYDTRAVEHLAVNTIFRADFTTQEVLPFFDPQPNKGDYSSPALSPDGLWLAMRVKPDASQVGDQVWVSPQDGSFALTAADEPQSLYANISWDPQSTQLVIYRVQLGVANPEPEIWLWDRLAGESRLLVQNGSAPLWLP